MYKIYFLVNNTKKYLCKGMIFLKRTLIIMICIVLIIIAGVFIGLRLADEGEKYNTAYDNNMEMLVENTKVPAKEVVAEEKKTTPNTLVIYKTYYTKCKHYMQEYKDIDASLVNLTEKELKEKIRSEWSLENFSNEEIEMSKEIEGFCGQHYKLKLENNVIVIYNVDENGIETEYEQTGITTEYLTNEDISKLTTGIYVYGKENLTSTIEDYE